ncbi:GvpL/GvpF family gas vesicle protein [Pseudoroseomonas cervicalis]|uniref:GvpL/GvpF family gas vesicle protein n=1 Tax=Teichococcus cervicalis TaxID=204525 RepID=UPI0022F14A20|nr:GvpL/GvpF family gas vesicle protein [Pseudoroseomonas cervicalis]WBV43496.1 GvpL/GvpF family gas vesicle protein [Pseudoroseomonas cervicalis]
MTDDAWYAYAVLPAAARAPRLPGILPEAGLVSLPAGAVAVLASPVPRAAFAEETLRDHARDPAWLAARAAAHHAVIMAATPCLPFAFGALFSGTAPLLDWAARRGEDLAEALERLDGRAEWSLLLEAEPAAQDAHLCATAPDLVALRRRMDGAGPGTAFLLRRRLEQLLPGARHAHLAGAREALATLLEEAGLAPLPEAMPGRLSVLAGEAALARLRPRLEAFGAELAGSGLGLRLSGPWPAYGFARALLAQDAAAEATP